MSQSVMPPVANGPATSEVAFAGTSSIASDLMVLTKARLSLMVMITTFIGSCMASGERIQWLLLLNTLLGTAFSAGGSQALNQVIEAEVDQFMARTRNRPLPAGRMRRTNAAVLGFVLCLLGVFYLAATVNALTAYLSAATIIIYLLLYTPLKRRSAFCIAVGAVAGAIPPVIGWTAVRQSLDAGAWILFAILFCWQMPHFLAIAWMYHQEYARAGFVMLRRDDTEGRRAAAESFVFSLALLLASIAPVFFQLVSRWYLFAALICNLPMILLAGRFLMTRSKADARNLFLASLLFLPLLLGLMVCGKL